MSVKSRLVLVGGGAFAREILCWLEHVRQTQELPSVVGFLGETPSTIDQERYRILYLGQIENFAPGPNDRLVMAIGDPSSKEITTGLLRNKGGQFSTIVHPTAVMASTATIGEGCVICPNALISADVTIGSLVSINTVSTVGHDVQVGNFSTLSSHVDLMGGVVTGAQVFFGSGARVLPKVKIGAKARIGAGAIVARTVREGVTMYAPMARRL